MAASDLCALQDVSDWLSAGGTALQSTANPLIQRLITGLSSGIYSYLSRQLIIPRTITERYDGVSSPRLVLRNYPIISVSGLLVNGTSRMSGTYPTGGSASAGWPPNGYLFQPWDGLLPGKPQALDLFAFGSFSWGRENVQVTYTAGYQVSNEVATVPAGGGLLAPQAPQGPWASDMGVSYADGTPLTSVASGTTPSAGQYVPPSGVGCAGTPSNYTFAAADAGEGILLNYGFVPAALNSACIEWVAERYRYMGRVGQKSETTAGQQTASYDLSGVPNFVKVILDPYRCVVPFYNISA